MYTTIYMKMSDNEVIIIKLWTFDSHTLPYWARDIISPSPQLWKSIPSLVLPQKACDPSQPSTLTWIPWQWNLVHRLVWPMVPNQYHGFQTLKKWREINAAIFTHTRTHTYIQIHTHTWTDTYTHTHAHTYQFLICHQLSISIKNNQFWCSAPLPFSDKWVFNRSYIPSNSIMCECVPFNWVCVLIVCVCV